MSADAPALPPVAQLIHIVERSARRQLTPVEANLLRQGLTELVQRLEVAGLALRDLREQSAADLRRARAEVEVIRREAAVVSPVVVACPFCGVEAGERCRPMRGAFTPRTPHTARLHAASLLLFSQALEAVS
jgi:hypothetical protein